MDARRRSTPAPPARKPRRGRSEKRTAIGEPAELLRSAFENAPIGMALTAVDGSFLAVNRALCELTGRDAGQLLGNKFQDVTHPDDLLATVRDARRMLAGEVLDHELEKRYLRPDGSVVWGLLRTTLVRASDGEPLHFISHIVDISERKQAEHDLATSARRLHELALRDPLTGLRNHRDFREALEVEIDRAARYERKLAMVIFDVDGFGQINVTRGRADGDAILRSVGTVIEQVSRRPDLAARIGGDEFGLVLPETDLHGARRAGERVAARITELYETEVRVSFGAATWSAALEKTDELLWAAERDLQANRPAPGPNLATTTLGSRTEETVRRLLEVSRVELDLDLEALGSFVVDPEVQRLVRAETAGSRLGEPVADRDGAMMRLLAALIEEVVDQERSAHHEHEAAVELTGIHALLAALEARDQYTGEHSRIVVELARGVAGRLGIGDRETGEIEQVALLHDVGKVGIPDSILLKRGALSPQEWELMRQHPAVGERIVANTESLAHLAPSIRAEHERFDGTGYPDGLAGDEIPIASRITLACDAYHAMTSDRPYRQALGVAAARSELLANAGSQFDPAVVAALIAEIDAG